jgi:hypothetical protein
MSHFGRVTVLLLAILGSGSRWSAFGDDDPPYEENTTATEAHAAVVTKTTGIPLLFSQEKSLESTEYLGVTNSVVYIYRPNGKNTSFIVHPTGKEFIYVGVMTGDKVVLQRKIQYQGDEPQSQIGEADTGAFSSTVLNVLAGPEASIERKEELCRGGITLLSAVQSQLLKASGAEMTIELSSVKVSRDSLVDQTRIKIMPDELAEKVKGMKIDKPKWYLEF